MPSKREVQAQFTADMQRAGQPVIPAKTRHYRGPCVYCHRSDADRVKALTSVTCFSTIVMGSRCIVYPVLFKRGRAFTLTVVTITATFIAICTWAWLPSAR